MLSVCSQLSLRLCATLRYTAPSSTGHATCESVHGAWGLARHPIRQFDNCKTRPDRGLKSDPMRHHWHCITGRVEKRNRTLYSVLHATVNLYTHWSVLCAWYCM